jgi:uncharacterized protein YceH (UPF0502 family)
MSDAGSPLPGDSPAEAANWEPLAVIERRVLGVLVEKQKTSKSADTYPLSLNALTTGCNQKSNREPVLDLSDDEVEEALAELQKKGLVMRITGGRVDRFRHQLYDVWTRDGPQLSVLAELLLRGPQTKGELRIRASRMDPIDTLETLEEVLKPLVERRLVVWLGDPDRRGAMLTHGFHTAEELSSLKSHSSAEGAPSASRAAPATPPPAMAAIEDRLEGALAEIAHLRDCVQRLEAQVAEMKSQLGLG